MTQDGLPKLREIFRAVFELPPDADVARVRQLTQPNWDSLAHVTLVAAIENEFGIELAMAESLRITSYAAAELLLREKTL